MPSYRFRCPKCKREIELQKSIKDDSVPLCLSEDCGAIDMEQIIEKSSFILSGKGWFKTGGY